MASNPLRSYSVKCNHSGITGVEAGDSIESRIGRNIEPQPNGCWLYRGKPSEYGKYADKRAGMSGGVHRFVYEILVGDIDEGCHLHHKCETPGCCNPAHLVPLTPKEHAAAHKALRQTRPS